MVLQSRSAANICFLPNASVGISFMSVDTELIRIVVARTVLSPARKIGGSYLCTMRATSEYVAIDTIQAFLGIYGQFWIWHYPLIYKVRGSAPEGSSPRDCAVLFKQWRIISKSLHYSPVSCLREIFSHAPDGSYALKECIGLILHTHYVPEMSYKTVFCVLLVWCSDGWSSWGSSSMTYFASSSTLSWKPEKIRAVCRWFD